MAAAGVSHSIVPRTRLSEAFKSLLQVRRLATVSSGPNVLSPAKPYLTKPCLKPATFQIKHGPTFHGSSFGANVNVSGEAVFTTSLVGYPESMTDPSYRRQILVFTQPLIGNYGVPGADKDSFGLLRYFESSNIQTCGIVVGDVALEYSHWTAVQSLAEWCAQEGVPGISGVDTRAIVSFLRNHGSSRAKIAIGRDQGTQDESDQSYGDEAEIDLVKIVSPKEPFHIPSPGGVCHIALVDCGAKQNIIRSLVSRGMSVTCLPYDFPIHKHAHQFDGVFISNGPGNPVHCKTTIENLRLLMQTSNIPIMGICLGHQLLALAAGARTLKMKYGNRAHNIPALDLVTGRCHITSQNHGYAVDASTLPSDFKQYFANLNDGSNEGIIHKSRPIFSTQFHPEAKGGPLDTSFLFDVYLEQVQKYKKSLFEYSGDYRPSPMSMPLPVDLRSPEHVDLQRAESL